MPKCLRVPVTYSLQTYNSGIVPSVVELYGTGITDVSAEGEVR